MSIYLAIDTTMNDCSVALLRGDDVTSKAAEQPRNHANELLPLIDAVLAEAKVGRDDLTGIIVVNGPGSFTGVRIGVSVAQGLALALSIPVAAVSSIAVTAHRAWRDHGAAQSLVLLDARLNEVYSGAYAIAERGVATAIVADQVIAPAALVLPNTNDWLIVGNGRAEYAEHIPAEVLQCSHQACMPHAVDAAWLGRTLFATGQVLEATDLEPVYLRNKVADIPASKAVW